MVPIPIHLAVEDALSEAVLRKLLRESGRQFEVGNCYSKGGYGYLKKVIFGLNNAAKGCPFLVLTDLDNTECPPLLIKDWLSVPKHPNLLFRIAVREVESWLLGDQQSLSRFLRIKQDLLPIDVDNISNPKTILIGLARRSPNQKLREAIVPAIGSTANIGPDYNGVMITFVNNFWNVSFAAQQSQSLSRAVSRLRSFQPYKKSK